MVNSNLLHNTSKLILVHSFEETLALLQKQKRDNEVFYIYPEKNILINDVKNIIRHSYIKSEKTEYIIVFIEDINTQSQNSFLKILEEPPLDKYFILISKTKNIFLPTILSRLPLLSLYDSGNKISTKTNLDFNIQTLSLSDVYKFMQKNKNIQKQDAINTLEAIFEQIYNNNISLPKEELEIFSNSMKMLNINSKPIHILSTLLLKLQNYILEHNASLQTR